MERPSLIILKSELAPFLGLKITSVNGNSKQINIAKLQSRYLTSVKIWGKHLLLGFDRVIYLRVHFLMFCSCRINEKKLDRIPRLSLKFGTGELNLYTCSVKPLLQTPNREYDWAIDPMARQWDPDRAAASIHARKTSFLCDILLDQTTFAGVRNIIKNEVLFKLKLHPMRAIGTLSPLEIKKVVSETREYCFQCLKWKKYFVLKKNWHIYQKKLCPACSKKIMLKKTGLLQRVSFFCSRCQPMRSPKR